MHHAHVHIHTCLSSGTDVEARRTNCTRPSACTSCFWCEDWFRARMDQWHCPKLKVEQTGACAPYDLGFCGHRFCRITRTLPTHTKPWSPDAAPYAATATSPRTQNARSLCKLQMKITSVFKDFLSSGVSQRKVSPTPASAQKTSKLGRKPSSCEVV